MFFILITLFFSLLVKADTIDILTEKNVNYNYNLNTFNTIDIKYRQQRNGMLYIGSTLVSLINSNNETLQSITTYTNKYSNVTTRLQFPYIQQYEEVDNQNFTINIIGLGTYNLFNGSNTPTKLLLNTTDQIFIKMNYNNDNFSVSSSNTNTNPNIKTSFLFSSIFFMFIL